jgi:hypothetical protein
MFVRRALKVFMQSDGDFVDVILLYWWCAKGCSEPFCTKLRGKRFLTFSLDPPPYIILFLVGMCMIILASLARNYLL